MGFACLAWLHNHVHPHQTGDLETVDFYLHLSPCAGRSFLKIPPDRRSGDCGLLPPSQPLRRKVLPENT
jgi:hypothetical protein